MVDRSFLPTVSSRPLGLTNVFSPRLHSLRVGAAVLSAALSTLASASLGSGLSAQAVSEPFGPRSVADERVEVSRGPAVEAFDAGRERIALGLRPGAPIPTGARPSPFPGVLYADVQLDLGLSNWDAEADSWLAHPDVDWVSPILRGLDGGPVVFPREVLVGVEPGRRTDDEWRSAFASIGLDAEPGAFAGTSTFYRCRSIHKDAFETLALLRMLAGHRDVRFAEPDAWFSGKPAGALVSPAPATTTDPFFNLAWGLENTGQQVGSSPAGTSGIDVGAIGSFAIEKGRPEIVIAVIDVGVDLTHPDLNLLLPGTDTTNDPASLGDGAPVNSLDRHGTAVTGVAVGVESNGIGGAGLAPQCRALSIRSLITVQPDGSWVSQASFTVTALEFAQQNAARVTNNSNVYGFQSSAIDAKYAELRDLGVVHVASAGNFGQPNVGYPSSLPTVLSVSGIDPTGAPFDQGGLSSNSGPEVFLTGPGQDILTTDRQAGEGYVAGDYVLVTGTSFSGPFVAATAALAFSIEPDLSAEEVEVLLASTAFDLGTPGRDNQFGFGLVRADGALHRLQRPRFPGTGSTLEIGLGPTSNALRFGPGAFVETVRGGETLVISLSDPTGAFVNAPCAISIGLLGPSGMPTQILPGFWFDLNAIVVTATGGLPASGFDIQLNAPLMVAPGQFLAQGVALGPAPHFDPESSWAAEVRIR